MDNATQPAPRLQLRVPAKLNTFLHITGRRADGYHLLQTVFRAINLFDQLDLVRTEQAEISRSHGPENVPVEQDLCVRAAKALQRAAQCRYGATIALHKRIPMGAGMGGGSSDAAGVLLGLNSLWQLHWPIERLSEIALSLGADVPFFLRGGDQWAEGVGEQLMPMQGEFALAPAHYVIVLAPVHCNTALLFAHPALQRNLAPITPADYCAGAPTVNVFEAVVLQSEPEVAAAHYWLLENAGNARLTGSGAAVFAQVQDHKQAVAIKNACPPQWQSWFAHSLAGH